MPIPVQSQARFWRSAALATLAPLALATSAHAQSFDFAIDPAASSATYDLTVSAPLAGTPALPSGAPVPVGTSYLIGGAAATPATTPPTRTRPSTSLFGTSFTGNFPVAITAGSISATGNSGTSAIHPTGAFRSSFNMAAGTASIEGLSISLLGGATAAFNVAVSISFQSFHTREPNSILLIPGATIPVNQPATITSLIATQQPGTAVGTLTPTTVAGVFTFSVPLTVDVAVVATLNGNAIPVDPQTVEFTLTGTFDSRVPGAVPLSASITINDSQTQPGPLAFDPQAIDEPIYGGKLLATLVIQSITVALNAGATIVATGTPVDDPTDPLDINGDGTIDPDDLADYIAGYFAVPPAPFADFNGDGTADPDDLADYIAGYFGQ